MRISALLNEYACVRNHQERGWYTALYSTQWGGRAIIVWFYFRWRNLPYVIVSQHTSSCVVTKIAIYTEERLVWVVVALPIQANLFLYDLFRTVFDAIFLCNFFMRFVFVRYIRAEKWKEQLNCNPWILKMIIVIQYIYLTRLIHFSFMKQDFIFKFKCGMRKNN